MVSEIKHTVLVVDDDEAILHLISRQLEKLNCTIVPTSSSAEAIHILKSREIAVLLCDLNMPNIGGNVVLTTAREANPNVISILITGASDHSATIKAINEGGISKYLAKPWDTNEFVAIVTESLQRYSHLCHQQAELENLANSLETQTSKRSAAPPPNEEDSKKKPRRTKREELVSSRYKLGKIIGQGGMGAVFKADDLLLDMPVAIKVLHPRFTRDEAAITTLKEEARIAMQLSHRHIVRLHNLQESQQNYFLVMEYVEGRTFREVLGLYEKLPLDTVLQIVRVCAEALAYAHRHHVLHKDLKPGNLLLDKDGVLKIIDFGLASLTGKPDDTRFVAGTPVYMSPEQVRGEELDQRTDVYSFGIVVYELISGRTPFPLHTKDMHLISAGIQELPGVPDEMEPILRRAMAKDRADRWPSIESFATALQEAQNSIFLASSAT